MRRHWKIMMRSSRVSMFHQDVSDVIAAMQIEHQMEYLAEDGILSVDVAVVRHDQKVAVEVDGPYHYTLNTHQPLGHTLLRSPCSFQSHHCSHSVDVLLCLHQDCSSLLCWPYRTCCICCVLFGGHSLWRYGSKRTATTSALSYLA